MRRYPIWETLKKRAKDPESEIIEQMKMIRVFEGLPDRSLRFIRDLCHVRHYPAEEYVFRMGEPGVGMYLVLSGRVEIYRMEGNYKRRFQVLQQGDSFGELGLLEDINRSASAMTLEKSTLLGFFRPDLESMIQRKPRLASRILYNLSRVIGQKLVQTNETLEEISRTSAAASEVMKES